MKESTSDPDLPSSATVPPKTSSKRKRKLADEEGLDRIKRMRKRGACLRCRLYRMKCDEGGPCQNCLKVRDTATIFKQPCEMLNIKDIVPFRPGSSRNGKLRSELPVFSWSSDTQVRQITVSSLIPGTARSQLPSLQIKCRKHHINPQHVLEEGFVSIDKKEVMQVKFPPYACKYEAESTRVRKDMDKYLDDLQPFGEAGLDHELRDELLLAGLKEARRYSKNRTAGFMKTVATQALKIQAAAWISEIVPVISSDETLGITKINNENFSQHGQYLIPVSLDSRLDHLYIDYMFRNLKVVVTGLNRLIFARRKEDKRKHWYEIFLTIFVLLATLEMVHSKQIDFIQKFTDSGENFLAKANYVKRGMIEEWEYSARNIIYHFRAIVKGMVPFSQTWTEEMKELADVDGEAMEYITKTSKMIHKRKEEFARLSTAEINNDTTTPLVWIAQILADG